MKRRHLLAFALSIATGALVVTGCGGGGSSSSDTAQAMSKAEFAKAMDDLCSKATASTAGLGDVQGMEDLASIGPGYLAAIEGVVDDLNDLEPPAEIKAQVEGYISNTEKLIDALGGLIAVAKENDSAAYVKLTESAGPEVQEMSTAVDAAANAIGAPACTAAGV